jgi:uncharacterized RDD family membrane protein YckC
MAEANSEPRIPTVDDFPKTGVNSLASVPERAVAWILDLLLVMVPTLVVFVVVLAALDLPPDAGPEEVWAELPRWLPAVPVIIWVLYVVPAISWKGQTPSQWLFGHRVARYTDGRKPHLDQAALRALLPAALAVLPLLVISGNVFIVLPGWVACYAVAPSNPLLRGLHDLAAGTIVVRTR